MVEAAMARNRAMIAEKMKAEKKAEEFGNIHEKWRDEVQVHPLLQLLRLVWIRTTFTL
jgi:hypothetical protein